MLDVMGAIHIIILWTNAEDVVRLLFIGFFNDGNQCSNIFVLLKFPNAVVTQFLRYINQTVTPDMD